MTTDRDDDFGALDLDDMPGIPPHVRNIRVAADLLYVDPPPDCATRADGKGIVITAADTDDMRAWLDRRYELHEFTNCGDGPRSWFGVIEGVPVRVDCEVTA